jgi:hypothetical protein
LEKLRQVLSRFEQFNSHATLRAVFVGDALVHWRKNLPEAVSSGERINVTIDYLLDKRHRNGRHALLLLLDELCRDLEPDDELLHELKALIIRIEQAQVQNCEPIDKSHSDGSAPLSTELQHLLDKIVHTFYNRSDQESERQHLAAQFASTTATGEQELAFAEQLLRLATADQGDIHARLSPVALKRPLSAINHYLKQIAGDSTMASNTHPSNYTAFVFATTAKVIVRELAFLEQQSREWPDLIMGDELTAESLASLRTIHDRMNSVGMLMERFSLPENSLLQRDVYNGLIQSVSELTNVFETVDSHLAYGRVPENIIDQMERLSDDIRYYGYRCFQWLNQISERALQEEGTLA